jgi:hypothetical protein
MIDEDSPHAVLGAGRMELCWLFFMMHCSPQSANRKHVSSVSMMLVPEADVFALHMHLYCSIREESEERNEVICEFCVCVCVCVRERERERESKERRGG